MTRKRAPAVVAGVEDVVRRGRGRPALAGDPSETVKATVRLTRHQVEALEARYGGELSAAVRRAVDEALALPR